MRTFAKITALMVAPSMAGPTFAGEEAEAGASHLAWAPGAIEGGGHIGFPGLAGCLATPAGRPGRGRSFAGPFNWAGVLPPQELANVVNLRAVNAIEPGTRIASPVEQPGLRRIAMHLPDDGLAEIGPDGVAAAWRNAA